MSNMFQAIDTIVISWVCVDDAVAPHQAVVVLARVGAHLGQQAGTARMGACQRGGDLMYGATGGAHPGSRLRRAGDTMRRG